MYIQERFIRECLKIINPLLLPQSAEKVLVYYVQSEVEVGYILKIKKTIYR